MEKAVKFILFLSVIVPIFMLYTPEKDALQELY